MTVLAPIEILNFTSNLPETEYAAWVNSTTYNIGDYVIYSHKIYRSVIDSNLNIIPSSDATKWQDTGATNAWRVIDNKISTQSVGSDIVITFLHGKSTKIHILNVETQEITVEILVDAIPVETQTKIGVYRNNLIDYWEWFTEDFIYITSFEFDVQYNPLATVRISTIGASKIGIIASGIDKSIGLMLWDANPGVIDYSRIETDEWGNTFLAEGAWSSRLSGEVVIPTASIDEVTKKIVDRRAKASVFNAYSGYGVLKIYGFVRDFQPILKNPNRSSYSLQIEGLI